MQSVPPFDEAVALRLRELRSLWGLSLEDVAASARSIGLDWSRGTVWAIEKIDRDSSASGSRRLAIGEFLLLPAILQGAAASRGLLPEVALDDVMPRADQVRIGGLRLSSDELRGVLAGLTLNPRALANPELRTEQRDEVRDALEVLARARIPDAADKVLAWGRLPVERSVGRRLGVVPEIAAIAGYQLWEESLTARRDEIASANTKPTSAEDEARRQLTATRGHATREILNDEAFVESVRELNDQLTDLMVSNMPRPQLGQLCRWCRGSGMMPCPGSLDAERSADRQTAIRRALVDRYCEDDELRARIDAEALAGQATSHAAPGERCAWCERVGQDAGYLLCPRCLGASVDPQACLPGRAPTEPEPKPGDRLAVPGRVLRALSDVYVNDERFRRLILQRIEATT